MTPKYVRRRENTWENASVSDGVNTFVERQGGRPLALGVESAARCPEMMRAVAATVAPSRVRSAPLAGISMSTTQTAITGGVHRDRPVVGLRADVTDRRGAHTQR